MLLRDRFFDVPRTRRSTSPGSVELPILYRDASNVVALFLARREGAEEILRGTGLVPAITSRHRALVAVSFYEYRDTSIGSYNEVGSAIVVRREGARPRFGVADLYLAAARRRLSAYVVDLPVTTRAADAAGRELWGYPKFIADIPFRMRGRDVETSVIDPETGAPIVTLAGQMGPGVRVPPLSLATFSHLGGALIRTEIDVRGPVTAHAPGSVRLVTASSRHRMAERLRTLGLTDARPLLVLRTDRFQSKLHAGTRQT